MSGYSTIINMNYTYKKNLIKRQMLMGAQFCYAHDMMWISLVGLFTEKTAIARIRIDNELIATPMFILLLISSLLLTIDFFIYLSDQLKGTTYYRDNKIANFIADKRNYFLIVGAIWHICLLSTVSAEQGIGPVIAYAAFSVVGSLIGMAIAVRDGCIDRQINKT